MATELRFFSGLTSPLPTTTAPSSSSSSGYNSRSTLSIARKPLATSFLNGGAGAFKVTRLSIACSGRNRRGGALVSHANLFDRFARVVKSYAIALISSFEDPEKILEQTVLEMNDDLIKMCKAMTQVLASQKQLENRYKAAQQSSEYWHKRAQLALGKGDEDLAREALKRRKSFSDNATALKTQLDQQRAVVDSLVPNTRILESKIREAKSRKDTLKARARSATTQTKVSEMVGNLSTNTTLGVFENMEEKVLALECQGEAIGQFTTDDLEGKFSLLEASSVDDDLTSLQEELPGSSREYISPERSASIWTIAN